MIRAGRTVLNAEEVATACGYPSLRAAKAAGLFEEPSFPRPVNQHGDKPGYKMLWDQEQILAHREDRPVPAVPAADSPDDLLDAHESAGLWGISRATWDTYAKKTPHLIPTHRLIHGVKFWRRQDLIQFPRPGKGAGAGRRPGSTDTRPRTRQGKDERLTQVAELLADAAAEGVDLSPADIAARLGISKPYARSLLQEASAPS
ncbi:hypothetical protein [Actinomadura rayongensis]|uniref:Uncharacterized protein n=1 Tax=Actinomadura rayongensis TaxID=1429076 RepID=A0A6I4WG91_9ACTN|nr:hypothetical protein [Actinomadura rayongensis]MXQ65602.1 hypothetical protein [Actinomadura rayongensis]